jgi:hypothetical protein
VKQTHLLDARENVCCAFDVPLAVPVDQLPHFGRVVQAECARSAQSINEDKSHIVLVLDSLGEILHDIGVV